MDIYKKVIYRPKGPGVFFLLYTENVVKICAHVTIINDTTTTTICEGGGGALQPNSLTRVLH